MDVQRSDFEHYFLNMLSSSELTFNCIVLNFAASFLQQRPPQISGIRFQRVGDDTTGKPQPDGLVRVFWCVLDQVLHSATD